MLPAANRLRTAADFRTITRTGTKVSRGSVVVYVATDGAPVGPLVGVITSKAIGGSVTRHRAARRIRGAVGGLLSTLPQRSRIVVRALPGAESAPGIAEDVRSGIRTALSRRLS